MIVSAFVIALTSYQPVQARANNFTLKPVRVGDNLLSILRRHGFSEKERQEVLVQGQGLRRRAPEEAPGGYRRDQAREPVQGRAARGLRPRRHREKL